MDFDNDFTEDIIEENYDEYHDEGWDDAMQEMADAELEPPEDSMFDEMHAGALGFVIGYETASDELNEQEITKDILRRRENKNRPPERISLRARIVGKGYKIPPAHRWMMDVSAGRKKPKDPVEYTEEEKRAILDYEGEHDFEC